MYRFIETIRIENGIIHNLEFHTKRMSTTLKHFFPECSTPDLRSAIEIPKESTGRIRCRICYGKEIMSVEYFPYQTRSVKSLQPVECDIIDYSYKYDDRDILNRLFGLRGKCDDIIIIRNGMITDTSIANIALQDKEGKWLTPSSPLLRGTMRSYLLDKGIIEEKDIPLASIYSYENICLFNAMIPFGEVCFPTRSVSASLVQSE